MNNVLIKVAEDYLNLYEIKKATIGSAGFDLVAAISKGVILSPNKSVLIPCGIFIEMPDNIEAQVRPRSGLALKNMITVLNSPGTIDSDYRGEIKVILINHSAKNYKIQKGMRIAQIIFHSLPEIKLVKVKNLSKTCRGEGGFGSTGMI